MDTVGKVVQSLRDSTSPIDGGRPRCTETGCYAESFLEHGSLSVLPSLYHRSIASNRPVFFDHDYGI
jgi:hypothetical protein